MQTEGYTVKTECKPELDSTVSTKKKVKTDKINEPLLTNYIIIPPANEVSRGFIVCVFLFASLCHFALTLYTFVHLLVNIYVNLCKMYMLILGIAGHTYNFVEVLCPSSNISMSRGLDKEEYLMIHHSLFITLLLGSKA